MQPQSQNLTDYVRSALAQGLDAQTVRNNLLQAGWPASSVDEAFTAIASASAPVTTPTKKSRKKLIIIVAILAAFVLFVLPFIILIVFLAVPNLQKNSNNNQKKNDVSMVASYVSDYISKNSGALPKKTAIGANSKELQICGDSCATGVTVKGPLTSYTANAITIKKYTASIVSAPTDRIYIVTGAVCSGTTVSQGSPSQVALLYTAGTPDCLGL